MGYCVDQVDSKFFVARENLHHVFGAIRALMAQVSGKRRGFAWVDTQTVLEARTVEEQLHEWRWEIQEDDDGNIIGLSFTGEKLGEDHLLFQVIAPFVKEDSFIDMHGEDGEQWRWSFDGSTCEELEPEVTYRRSKGKVIDGEFSEQGTTSGRISAKEPSSSNVPKPGALPPPKA